MPGTVDILCLANSEKHGQRCLAGIRLDTGGWIRPVSTNEGGALYEDQYTTECGKIPRPLDSIRIHFEEYSPRFHQPENWRISDDESWELLDSEINEPQQLALNTALQRDGKIFSSEGSSLRKSELKDSLSTNSLTLLRPQDPQFYTDMNEGSSNQPRTAFDFDGHRYDLPITDPKWRQQVQGEDPDDLPSIDDLDDDQDILFTISLGEPFEGRCYKLVAAIFSLDNGLIIDL
jgi:hypothetical protein